MEFTQYKCPVCQERFKSGDDIVVCPECGAPHHRECYEQNGSCFYEDKHSGDFSFEAQQVQEDDGQQETSDVLVCPVCRAENEKTAFYCGTCGAPLNARDDTRQTSGQAQNTSSGQRVPFGYGATGAPVFDPLVGLNSEDEIADGVKVGEAAKFIGKSTPYYLMVFNRIKKTGASKFNLSAFLFSGAYFIYRKMYTAGILIILTMIGLSVASSYMMMSGDFYANYNALLSQMQDGVRVNPFSGEMLSLLVPALLSSLRFVIMLICGFRANRAYYKHCTKVINETKQEETDGDLSKTLEAKGGVNLPMAVSFFAAFAVIYEICNFIVNSQSFWQ